MINTINIHNYEIYFLDFLDGKLSEKTKQELFRFIEEHPNLNDELIALGGDFPILEPPANTQFTNKLSLKKATILSEDEGNYIDEQMIALLEGDLSEVEKESLNQFIANDKDQQKAFGLFRASRLKSPSGVLLSDKHGLKRHLILPLYNKTVQKVYAAAAVLIIVLFAGQGLHYFLSEPTAPDYSIAEQRELFFPDGLAPLTDKDISNNRYFELLEKKEHNINQLSAFETAEKQLVSKESKPLRQNLFANTRMPIIKDAQLRIQDDFATPIHQYASMEVKANIPDDFIAENQIQGRSYSVKEYLMYRLQRKVSQVYDEEIDTEGLNLYHMADAGLNRLQRFSNGIVQWKPERNEKGDLEYYAITTPLFEIKRKVSNKSESE